MVKKDGFLACKDDARGRERLTLDKENAANLKRRRWNPARDRLSDRDNEQDVYQADEAALFNLILQNPFVPSVGNNGRGSALAPANAVTAAIHAKTMYDIIAENKRPGAWIASATSLMSSAGNLILSSQNLTDTKSTNALYGSIPSVTLTGQYTAFDAGWCGLGLLRCYQVTGSQGYIAGARRIAGFIRNLQASSFATIAPTSLDAAGTSPYYTGFWSNSIENISGTPHFDHYQDPINLIALEFLRLLLSIDGDGTYGADTTISGFFTRIPQVALSQMISDAMLPWNNGLFNSTTNTTVNGLSATTPFWRFNPYPTNKQSPVFIAPGTGSWELNNNCISVRSWAYGIHAIWASEGVSSRITSLWNYLQSAKPNPSFATPVNTGPSVLFSSQTGTFYPTLAPPPFIDVTTGQMSLSSTYDWVSWGLLSPIQSAKNSAQLKAARVVLGQKKYRIYNSSDQTVPTDFIGMYGTSGLSFQTAASAGNAAPGDAAIVEYNYRQAPILFPMQDPVPAATGVSPVILSGSSSDLPSPPHPESLAYWMDGQDMDGQRNATLTDGAPSTFIVNKGTRGIGWSPVGIAPPITRLSGGFGSIEYLGAATGRMATPAGSRLGHTTVLVLVLMRTAVLGVTNVYCDGLDVNGRIQVNDGDGNDMLLVAGAGSALQAFNMLTIGKFNVITLYMDGTGSSFCDINFPFADQGHSGVGNSGTDSGFTGITIGDSLGVDKPFQGKFAALLCWNSASTASLPVAQDVCDFVSDYYSVGWPKTALSHFSFPPVATSPLPIHSSDVVAFMGDSISTSIPGARWFDPAVTTINSKLSSPITVVPAGVGGNTFADLVARVNADIINHIPKPTVVVIECGENDLFQRISLDTIITNAETLVLNLRAGIPNVRIAMNSILCRNEYYPDPIKRQVDQINKAIEFVCAQVGATFVDIRSAQQAFEAANNFPPPGNPHDPGPPPGNRALLTIDGAHLTATGQALWSSTFVARCVISNS
jgi:lysophospholipase L1-like esterase